MRTETTINGDGSLTHDVTGAAGPVALSAFWTGGAVERLTSPAPENIWDGSAFLPGYTSSSRSDIAGGSRFRIVRDTTWPTGGFLNIETVEL